MPNRRSDATQYSLGTGIAAGASGSAVNIAGGEYMFFSQGTVSGSTVSLQMLSPDGSSWADIAIFAGSIVKTTTLPFNQTGIVLPAGQVRLTVTGGTGSGISGYLVGLG